MLQKKAPNDLKSLDAELKSAHALRGAAGRARPAQGYGPSLRFCKRTEGSTAERSKGFTARRRPSSYPRRTPRCAAEGRRGETWTSRSPNYRRRVSRARGMSRSSAAQSELDARPEGNFSWLQGLEKSRNAERILRSARGRGRPSEHLRRNHPRGLPRACRSLCKALAGLDEERRRRYGASGRPFVPGAARVKATCYFFCDFT